MLDNSCKSKHSFFGMAAHPRKAGDLSKKQYENKVPRLRERLIQLQVSLKACPFPIIFIVAGLDGAGKGDVVNTLNAWLDPRGLETLAFTRPSDEEKERPAFWRYWRSLPPKGRMGIYYSSWHSDALLHEIDNKPDRARFNSTLAHCAVFEKMLAADGALIIKVWLHISKKDQRERLLKLEGNPRTAWRVSESDWMHHAQYDKTSTLARHLIRRTDQPSARWTTINGAESRARSVAIAELLLNRFAQHQRAFKKRVTSASTTKVVPLRPSATRLLRELPLDQKVSPSVYEKKKDKLLGRLNRLLFTAREVGRSVVFVFEGWDAAGKGGAIRRLTSAIDAPFYRVIPVAAPTDEEKSHHYLWRFWRHVPREGMVTIYDRSWYGRVLVERIEGYAQEAEWRRAYAEINDFEAQLTEGGSILIKFWMHIGKEEQLRRFRSREEIAYKRHKINDEDWRNRRRWEAYETCVSDMIALTNTSNSPWNLIAANDKRHARMEILSIACNAIESEID